MYTKKTHISVTRAESHLQRVVLLKTTLTHTQVPRDTCVSVAKHTGMPPAFPATRSNVMLQRMDSGDLTTQRKHRFGQMFFFFFFFFLFFFFCRGGGVRKIFMDIHVVLVPSTFMKTYC